MEESKGLKEIYGIFCGDINLFAAQKISASISHASSIGIERAHILFHSWGGFVGDGIFLHNLFKSAPFEIFLYNAGHIASAATIAFLGATNRITTKNAMFMIHKCHTSPQGVGADKLKNMVENLEQDDRRTEEILKTHLKLSEELWAKHAFNDVQFLGEESLGVGISTNIGEFAPPKGSVIYNLLA